MKCYRTYIPTALSKREAMRLQAYAYGRRVVEAGALLGFSTIALAEVAEHVVSIDRHTGYYGRKLSLRTFQRNLEVCNVAGKVSAVVDDFARLAEFSADFAFIDLDGTRDTTLRAIALCKAQFIGVHDYARLNCGGVDAAVRDSGLPVVERADSLIILRRAA
jgi:predicted rRNA methylase YqxC with S4 and FtsJ domains